jgi:hypothetical protein
MSRVMKYVMFELDTPIVFPDHLIHADMARSQQMVATSAGFCHIGGRDELGNPQFVCYGESISLQLKSRDKDSEIMNRTFGTTY